MWGRLVRLERSFAGIRTAAMRLTDEIGRAYARAVGCDDGRPSTSSNIARLPSVQLLLDHRGWGRNFHRFPIDRVIEDIRDASARGAAPLHRRQRTLDVEHSKSCARQSSAPDERDRRYIVQA
jgi:hypothetical protein